MSSLMRASVTAITAAKTVAAMSRLYQGKVPPTSTKPSAGNWRMPGLGGALCWCVLERVTVNGLTSSGSFVSGRRAATPMFTARLSPGTKDISAGVKEKTT